MIKSVANYSEKSKGFDNKFYWVTAAIGAGVALVGGIANAVSQSKENEKNRDSQESINRQNIQAQKEINQSQLDYARAMTQAQWERDDNAHQREVADLQAAGLSPLASTSGSPVTSAQSYTPQSEAVKQAYVGQAPQFDSNALVQSLMQSSELTEKWSEHQDNLIRKDKSLDLEQERLGLSLSALNLEDKKLEAQIKQFGENLSLQYDQLSVTKSELKFAQDKFEKEQALQVASENSQMINDALRKELGNGFHSKVYTDFDEYEKALIEWGQLYRTYVSTLSKKGSKGWHAGINVGAGDKGAGINAGTNSSVNTNYEKSTLLEFTSKYPHPVYVKSIN